jgi:hypothetical protein
MLTPATVFIAGTDPVVRDGAELHVIYTTLPSSISEGSYIFIGDDELKVTKVCHLLTEDGSQYHRLVVYVRRDKHRKTPTTKLTPRKVRARM